MSKFKDNLIWFLQEVENAEPEYIETGEVEVYGETEGGLEGTCTVKISEICGEAAKELEAKDKENKKLRKACEIYDELIMVPEHSWEGAQEDLVQKARLLTKGQT